MSILGHLGNYNTATTRTHVRFVFSTHAAAGGNVAPNSAFENSDIRIYKATDGAAHSATQRSSANGITMTSPFDSLTGVHEVDIDLTDNTDASFYVAGFYTVMLAPDETVDSATITGIVLCTFEIGVPVVNTIQVGGTVQTARDIGASVLLPGGRVIPASDVGDIAEDATIVLRFNTVSTALAPIVLAGSPVISVYKDSITQRAGAEITLTVDYDGVVGLNHVLIDTSGDAFYEVGKSYTVVITTGTVSGVSVVGSVVGSFSIENRFQEVDVVKLGGGAQSATDLKDFADDGYDPSTNKLTGLLLADAVTVVNGLAANTITATSIAADAITAAKIADGAIDAATFAANAITATAIAADAITDAKVASDVTIASVTGAVGSVTGAVGSVTGAVGSVTGNVGGNVTGSVGSLAAQAKADVNAEVVDALAVDTYAEPGQGAPAATTTLAAKINYLFKSWRNKKTQTATDFKLYDDAGTTVDQKATHSDDATTYTSGEIGTGP